MLSLATRRVFVLVSRRANAAAPIAVSNMRFYSDGDKTPTAGATASSNAFKKREQAQENQYFQNQEREKLKKLQESIKQQRSDLDKLEKELHEASNKGSK